MKTKTPCASLRVFAQDAGKSSLRIQSDTFNLNYLSLYILNVYWFDFDDKIYVFQSAPYSTTSVAIRLHKKGIYVKISM